MKRLSRGLSRVKRMSRLRPIERRPRRCSVATGELARTFRRLHYTES